VAVGAKLIAVAVGAVSSPASPTSLAPRPHDDRALSFDLVRLSSRFAFSCTLCTFLLEPLCLCAGTMHVVVSIFRNKWVLGLLSTVCYAFKPAGCGMG
jgi:hypothetical protein